MALGSLVRDASATMIDFPLENAIICILCERLGFSFEVNNIFCRLRYLFPQYFECAAPHQVGSTGQAKEKSIKMQRHLIIAFCVPSCLKDT